VPPDVEQFGDSSRMKPSRWAAFTTVTPDDAGPVRRRGTAGG
jgi:hypothetical protein